MLKITVEDLQRTRPEYAALNVKARPEQPSGQCPYRVYNAQEAARTPIYVLPQLTSSEIIAHYDKLISPDFKTMTEEDFLKYLSVAFNVKNPLDMTTPLMGEPVEGVAIKENQERKPSKTSRVQFTTPQAAKATISIVPNTVTPTQTMDVDGEELEAEKANAICFAFAWTTKYCIKSPGNALPMQLKNMRESYLKFYKTSSATLEKFSPSKEWFEGIQTCFNSFPTVRHTLALYVAASETFLKGKSRLFNLARYLFFQSLEFMGMHAYVSVVKIANKVAMAPGVLLSWLRMQGVENAIDEIAAIMGNLDNGMIKDGDKAERLWKYARLIDEGYFNRLQTTYSADLIAVLAHIEIKLGMSHATGYNSPLNIYSLKNNAHLLERGEIKAGIFLDCLGSTSINDANASIIDKIDAARHGGLNLTESLVQPSAPVKRKRDEEDKGEKEKEKAEQVQPEKIKVIVAKPPINLLPKTN